MFCKANKEVTKFELEKLRESLLESLLSLAFIYRWDKKRASLRFLVS